MTHPHVTYRFEILPSEAQDTLLQVRFHCWRAISLWATRLRVHYCQETGQRLTPLQLREECILSIARQPVYGVEHLDAELLRSALAESERVANIQLSSTARQRTSQRDTCLRLYFDVKRPGETVLRGDVLAVPIIGDIRCPTTHPTRYGVVDTIKIQYTDRLHWFATLAVQQEP